MLYKNRKSLRPSIRNKEHPILDDQIGFLTVIGASTTQAIRFFIEHRGSDSFRSNIQTDRQVAQERIRRTQKFGDETRRTIPKMHSSIMQLLKIFNAQLRRISETQLGTWVKIRILDFLIRIILLNKRQKCMPSAAQDLRTTWRIESKIRSSPRSKIG